MNGPIPLYHQNAQQHEVVRLRRHLHQYPETGFTEYWTSNEICSYLSELGYEISYGKALYEAAYPDINHISELVNLDKNKIDNAYQSAMESISDDKWLPDMQGGFTGVIARLSCSDKGPKIGFRFDIDGLPIKESNNNTHKPSIENFTSKNQNMHACGHDGHTAIGLALAKQIAENREQLLGEFILVFQPSEEGPSGGEVFQNSIFSNNLIISFHYISVSLIHVKWYADLRFLVYRV
ncbi:M20/M25/M40 family metallo-hydrolase [Psychromonas sp. KJ10-2]|uniref:M20/M25/M40 family metallo-hydrolase n=1 Tax=Psychromonas sp. KJ10-2 TaxID=3391822 RepID=UPI0039B60097